MNKIFKKNNLTFKMLLFLISTDFLETFIQFCFKKSALSESQLQINAFIDIVIFVRAVISSPFLWLGLVSVALTFIIWSTILSRIDLSVAVPLCSFSYITIPIVSMFFLHEQMNMLRWIGIVFIIAGVILVSLSSKHKEGSAA